MSMQTDDELVTIRTYTISVYAETDRIHLENAGIPAFVADANTVMADYFLGNALGYIKLQVPKSRAAEALAIIDLHRTEPHAFSKDPPVDDEPVCLSCNAAMGAADERCASCGWSYADGAEADEPE